MGPNLNKTDPSIAQRRSCSPSGGKETKDFRESKKVKLLIDEKEDNFMFKTAQADIPKADTTETAQRQQSFDRMKRDTNNNSNFKSSNDNSDVANRQLEALLD